MTDMSFPPASASAPPQGETIRIDYVPRPGLLTLALVNALLGILTLTLYRFWARTNVRKHIWSSVHINGQPLEYTGRGSELFKGALIVFALFGLPAALLISVVSIAFGPQHPAVSGVQMALFVLVSLLWGAAIYRARRYQLSRTLWRGIRGTLQGSTAIYSLTYFGSLLARVLSLGWTTPVMNLNLQQQLAGAMRFGDLPFSFEGRPGPLYPTYALCWFLTLAVFIGGSVVVAGVLGTMFDENLRTLFSDVFLESKDAGIDKELIIGVIAIGILGLFIVYAAIYPLIWSLYTARELTLFAGYTRLGPARFRLDATAWSIIGLTIGNLLLWLLTLGIAAPFIQQRLVRYLCDRTTVEGQIDVDRILQSKAPLDKTGEGLADAFDVGGF